jgi:hypothetical protein
MGLCQVNSVAMELIASSTDNGPEADRSKIKNSTTVPSADWAAIIRRVKPAD